MSTAASGWVLDAARTGAVLFRAPERGTIVVGGRDRKTWLAGLVTSDVERVAPGVASYGLFLVKVGRILADVWVLDAGDRLLVAPPRDRVALLSEHLEQHLMMEDATHENGSDAWSWAHLHGPDAAASAAEIAREGRGFAGAVDATGLGGAVVAVPIGRATVGEERAPVGEEAGKPDAFAVGFDKRENLPEHPRWLGTDEDWLALRVARGVPAWGIDFSEKNYPQEAGLEKLAVSFSKGCYLGQEVVCRLEMRGHVTKKLVLVELDAVAEPPSPGAQVLSAEGKVLGALSSVAVVPSHVAPMALAMLRYDAIEPGTPIVVGGAAGRVVGTPPVHV